MHIERLVLEGVGIAPGQRRLLQTAVETELARLLSAGGLAPRLAGGGALPRVAGPAIQLDMNNGPTELALQVAGAIHGGIGT